MALDRLTKIDGGGISTTSDYRVGIITATKFVGPIEGTITATDGTFSGNVTIGGTLTYEDVTNIDSVGIITARDGIVVSAGGSISVGTGVTIESNGNSNFVGVSSLGTGDTGAVYLYNPDADALSGTTNDIYGWKAKTYTQGLQVNSTLYLSRSGSNGLGLAYNNATGSYITAESGFLRLGVPYGGYFNLYSNDVYIKDRLQTKTFAHFQKVSGTEYKVNLYGGNNVVKLTTEESGVNIVGTTTTTQLAVTGISTFTGNIDANGDLDVDGHTELDNVSIAGVTTVTDRLIFDNATNAGRDLEWQPANNRLAFFDVVKATFGNNVDLQIYHSGSHSVIHDTGTGNLTIQSNAGEIQLAKGGSFAHMVRCIVDGAVELYHNGTKKFETGNTVNINSNHFEITSGQQLRFDNSNNNRTSEILNTGSSGNSNLDFKTNGSSRMLIDNNGNLKISNNTARIRMGSSNQLELYHTGTYGYLNDTSSSGTELRIAGKVVRVMDNDSSHTIAYFSDSSAKFYANNYEKLKTTDTGINVVGEVATSQDYPNFHPTLDFNFAATKKLDSRITYRRTGPASFVNEFGKVVIVGDNAPRFDHDPVTRESKGLLIEESRTNYAIYSLKINNDLGSYYNLINNAVLVSDAGEAPDGTTTATKMYPGSSGGARGIEEIYTLPSTGEYTTSVYVKAAGHTGWIALYGVDGGTRAYFNPSTGTAGQPGTYPDTPAAGKYGIEDAGNGWYRCHLTVNLTSTGGTEYFYIYFGNSDGSTSVTHSGTNGILMWGLQVEKGSFPTSYIPTQSDQVTRGYEAPILEGTEFSDVFGTQFNEFSLVVDYDNDFGVGASGQNYALIDMWGESTGYNDRIEFFRDDASPYHIETRAFGQGNALFSNGNITASTLAKTQRFAASWYVPDYSNTSSRRFVISMGGEAVDVIGDNSGTTVPLVTRMGIGCNPTRLDFTPGLLHFKRLMVYNKTLSDNQLQNLSAQ